MWAQAIETLSAAGFLAVWLGFVVLILPMILRMLRLWMSAPPTNDCTEIAKFNGNLIADELQSAGKTRLGWWGQCLVAVGTSLLMVSGAIWLVLRILARHG